LEVQANYTPEAFFLDIAQWTQDAKTTGELIADDPSSLADKISLLHCQDDLDKAVDCVQRLSTVKDTVNAKNMPLFFKAFDAFFVKRDGGGAALYLDQSFTQESTQWHDAAQALDLDKAWKWANDVLDSVRIGADLLNAVLDHDLNNTVVFGVDNGSRSSNAIDSTSSSITMAVAEDLPRPVRYLE
jgi:hypothetical protein